MARSPRSEQVPSRFLQCDERDPRPLRKQAQVRIAAERSLMAELAQKLSHAGMVLKIPWRQVRCQPLDLERPRGGARRKRLLQNGLEH